MGAASFSYAADDNELRLGVGLDYTRGKYGGSTETTTLAFPLTARAPAVLGSAANSPRT